MYARYQPLPISTGAMGVDRCGNVAAYAAPNVVYARACWQNWPICPQPWPWPQPWRGGWSGAGWGCGCGCGSGLASILTAGAPMAAWMIANQKPPVAAPAKAAA